MRRAVEHAIWKLAVSERRVGEVVWIPSSTQRNKPKVRSDEPRLVKRIIELATQYGRPVKILTIIDEITRECLAIEME
jgi:hypothetical protein